MLDVNVIGNDIKNDSVLNFCGIVCGYVRDKLIRESVKEFIKHAKEKATYQGSL